MTPARSCALLFIASGGLAPVMAPGESQLQSGGGSTSATAHLNFRIVIPEVLYLNTGAADGRTGTVAVFSNGRNVALVTTVQGAGTVTAHLLLSAAGRRGISRISACEQAARPPQAAAPNRLVCTASTP